MRHHAIVVSYWDRKKLNRARRKAIEIFNDVQEKLVSAIVESKCNGYYTFLIAPDGSKEGWNTSNTGDTCRDDFIAWLKQKYKDDTAFYDWAEIQYGDDDCRNKMLRRSR